MKQLTDQLKDRASAEGFVLSGVTIAAQPGRYEKLLAWLDAGFAGSMHYLESRRLAYQHPSHILEGCSTLLMLGFPYKTHPPQEPEHGFGRVARYAWGTPDYHDSLFDRLKRLKGWLRDQVPSAQVRGVVDTAPLLEREFAEAAGLGWVGKNTLLLNRTWGSYFFLCALLTDIPLTPDPPYEKGFCGTCSACLDACPTQAFPEPYVLNATRCISYLTIEHRGPISAADAQATGNWLFGCDICQEVCPWNRRVPSSEFALPEPLQELRPADLLKILTMDADEFRKRFRKTPLWRAKHAGIIRNCILVLGNQKFAPALSHLQQMLDHESPEIASAAHWAVEQIQSKL